MSDITQILTREVESKKTPSVQYYIFDKNNIIECFQMGFANIARQKQIDSNSTYNAFSVTKTFTSLSVLQLAEREKLDINKLIIDFLPDFPYGAEITIKQILNHTAGIPNPIPIPWIHLEENHDSFDRNKFFQPIIRSNNKLKSLPNDKFAYSNLGYVILGQLIEKVSNKSYEEYVSENIIKKLPIEPGDLSFTIVNKEMHATGYHKRFSFSNFLLGFFIDKDIFMDKPEGPWRPFKLFYVNGASYGGLIGKPIAFVKYIQELLKENNSLIPIEYRRLLFQENKTNDNKNTGMGLSWFSGQLNGTNYWAHAGGGGGYYCEIRIYPEISMGSVVFFNRTGMTDERYLDKLDSFYINANR